MKIFFADRNPELVAHAKVLTDWTIVDSLFETPCTAIVSPANSYGFMDGGVDHYISQHCGPGVQERLQRTIKNLSRGELLVGQALAIKTDYGNFEYVISAPTMRVPMRILDNHSIFLAAKAATLCAKLFNFESIIFPGMGTGVGGVPPQMAIRLMKKGIDEALNPPEFPATWKDATENHYKG